MPIVFYTQQEYDNKMEVMYQKLFALTRKLVEAKGFTCIREPNNLNDYCDECPAKMECPYEFKNFSK